MELYKKLRLAKNATIDMINRVCRVFSIKNRPDKSKDFSFVDKFLEVQKAYTIISQSDVIADPNISNEIEEILNEYMGFETNKDNVQIYIIPNTNVYYICIPVSSCIPSHVYPPFKPKYSDDNRPYKLIVVLI